MENKPCVKLKTYTFYIKQSNQKNILNWMTKISRNIYNSTLFVYKVYKIYQNDIYKELYDYIIENKLETKFINKPKVEKKKYNKKDKKDKKDDDIVKIEDEFYLLFDKYYNLYIKNKNIVESNNKIIYKYIINDITTNNIVISNDNYKNLIDKYMIQVIKLNDITFNESNKIISIDNIIVSIVKSLYIKNYFYIKKLIEDNKEIDQKYNLIVNTINNKEYIYNDDNNHWRNNIIINLGIDKISSIENFINRLAYKYIGNNKEKLPSDVIINIIGKAFTTIKSYYGLLRSGKQPKANISKFLEKDAKFNLFYYFRSFKILDDGIRLNVGNYVHKNYSSIISNNYKTITIKNNIKYYNENNLIHLSKEKLQINKKNGIKYTKINNKYIDNDKLLSFNYIYIPLGKKVEYEKINLIEIKPIHNKIKVCITYEKEFENEIIDYDLQAYDKLSIDDKLKKTISIDTGILNLLTIYNPTGDQHIIGGNSLLSINHFYNKKIDHLNSLNKKIHNKNSYNRLNSLLEERENKINGFINLTISKLIQMYKDKDVFIVGYNPNWKDKVDIGKKNNRIFYQIPYKKLLDKLRDKLTDINKKLILVKESYTSKCDGLALESINFHEHYLGKRYKRGLFKSSTNKLINADLNGAINIMRKYIKLVEIKGKNLYNPSRINIYEMMSNKRPVSKSTSQQTVNNFNSWCPQNSLEKYIVFNTL